MNGPEGGLSIAHAQRLALHLRTGAADVRRFAAEGLPVTLSLSLHAPNDESPPPAHARAPTPIRISEVLAACRYYVEKTGRPRDL